jgi:hypothetical protein
VDWEYEQEVRVIASLSECEVVDIDGAHMHVINLRGGYVSGIIAGWNMADHHFEHIQQLVLGCGQEVRLERARIDNGRVVCQPVDA